MNKYLTRLIKHILVEDVAARDNWLLTVQKVHEREMSLWCFTREEYFEAVFGEKLSNVQSITRCWRLLQEKHPELRGAEWEERQKQGGMMASEVIEEKYFQMTIFGNQ